MCVVRGAKCTEEGGVVCEDVGEKDPREGQAILGGGRGWESIRKRVFVPGCPGS